MEDKRENLKKIENRGILRVFVLVLSAMFLLILWALFFVLSFVKALVKINPFKRKFRKGNNKVNKKE